MGFKCLSFLEIKTLEYLKYGIISVICWRHNQHYNVQVVTDDTARWAFQWTGHTHCGLHCRVTGEKQNLPELFDKGTAPWTANE